MRRQGRSPPTSTAPVTAAEAKQLFAACKSAPAVILAVSGGPDSTALLWLAARWRKALKRGPDLIAVTVDHALRRESAAEARMVKRLAADLGVVHRTLRWRGAKPNAGVPAAARAARYDLLFEAARRHGASLVVTAHTQDDQAETFLMRASRGSGVAGLSAMARQSEREGLVLARPLLDVPKSRLIATLARAKIAFAEDPSNREARFARPRWREIMPTLAAEGLDARTLARLAARLARANRALDAVTDVAGRSLVTIDGGVIALDAVGFATLPDEIALRLLGRAITLRGHEGPVELGKLEALLAALQGALTRRVAPRFKQTLAGATIALGSGRILVAAAPLRRSPARRRD